MATTCSSSQASLNSLTIYYNCAFIMIAIMTTFLFPFLFRFWTLGTSNVIISCFPVPVFRGCFVVIFMKSNQNIYVFPYAFGWGSEFHFVVWVWHFTRQYLISLFVQTACLTCPGWHFEVECVEPTSLMRVKEKRLPLMFSSIPVVCYCRRFMSKKWKQNNNNNTNGVS